MAERKQNTIARTFAMAEHKQGRYAFGVACFAFGTLCTVAPFFIVALIVDEALAASLAGVPIDAAQVLFWAGVTVVAIVLGMIASTIGSSLTHAAAFDTLYKLRMRILEHMGALPLGFYTDGRSGAIQKMMDANIEKMESVIAHDFPNLVGAACSLIALGVLMFSINVLLAVVTFVAIAVAFAIQFSAFGGKSGQKIWADLHRIQTDLDAGFSEYVAGMEEEKIFGGAQAASVRLAGLIDATRVHFVSYLKRTTPIFGAFKIITISLLSIILAAGTVLVVNDPGNSALVAALIVFIIVGPSVMNPLMELVELGSDLRGLAEKLNQIDAVLDLEPLPDPPADAAREGFSVRFENATFSYQPASDPLRRLALDHVSFCVEEGAFTALVGPSGGGKSTVGQMLARFWDVEGGAVTVGGADLRDITNATLMDEIAFVFQDTHIFAQTVRENIALGRTAEQEQIEAAAQAARCHDFICALPHGYDTRLGDGGHKLSGGEAQRIAIARAILKDAPIVVLDEAMAFTDAENELALRLAMEELLAGRTVLMIAHRLYSIKEADAIIVLDEGRVAEQGTHDELLDANGLYAHLWHIQNESDAWHLKAGARPGADQLREKEASHV